MYDQNFLTDITCIFNTNILNTISSFLYLLCVNKYQGCKSLVLKITILRSKLVLKFIEIRMSNLKKQKITKINYRKLKKKDKNIQNKNC